MIGTTSDQAPRKPFAFVMGHILAGLLVLCLLPILMSATYKAAYASADSTLAQYALNDTSNKLTALDFLCVWEFIPNVDPPRDVSIRDITIISASDIWVVGATKLKTQPLFQTFTMHWNGADWTTVPSPNLGDEDNRLDAVSASASNDVWAVGSSGLDGPGSALTLHWDGDQWEVVPNPSQEFDGLVDISAISQNNVWAVGNTSVAPGNLGQPYILHWNGAQWSQVSSPNPDPQGGLRTIAVVAHNDIWAAGTHYTPGSGVTYSLILHWDGIYWSVVPSPSTGTLTYIHEMEAIASNDVWAVGYFQEGQQLADTITMHWDGIQWSIVPSPNANETSNRLNGVSAISSNDIWAVGTHDQTGSSIARTLTMHWDGNQWTIVPSPNPATGPNILSAVDVDPLGNAWAVGVYVPFLSETLVLRHAPLATCATPSPTPNPSITPSVTNTITRTRTPTPTRTRTFTHTPTFTVTGTPPTATFTRTRTSTPIPPASATPRPTGCVVETLLREEFETGTLGHFYSTAWPTQAPGWSAVTDYPHSGDYAAFVPDVSYQSYQELRLTPLIPIPTNVTQATLSFWHRFSFEPPDWDCGWLYLSTDGGATWFWANDYFIYGGFNVMCNNDFFPLPGWGQSTGGEYLPVAVDLTSFRGQWVTFKFEERTDTSIGDLGWWIDDIKLTVHYTCPTHTPGPSHTATNTQPPGTTPTYTPTVTTIPTASSPPGKRHLPPRQAPPRQPTKRSRLQLPQP